MNLEAQPVRTRPPRHQADGTGRGEFDGVAEEIGEDLTDAQAVAQNTGLQVGGKVQGKGKTLVGRRDRDQVQNLVDQGAKFARGPLDGQFPRLDLGKVEDFIEDAEQGAGRGLDLAHLVPLPGVERAAQG